MAFKGFREVALCLHGIQGHSDGGCFLFNGFKLALSVLKGGTPTPEERHNTFPLQRFLGEGFLEAALVLSEVGHLVEPGV